jgi:hypothetical protein
MTKFPMPPLDVGMKLYEELHDEDQPDFGELPKPEQHRWQSIAMAAYRVLIPTPIPMLLVCPDPRCGARHVDEGEFETKPHHTHACQCCGMVWRPALVPTIGVQFLPGFKNED